MIKKKCSDAPGISLNVLFIPKTYYHDLEDDLSEL